MFSWPTPGLRVFFMNHPQGGFEGIMKFKKVSQWRVHNFILGGIQIYDEFTLNCVHGDGPTRRNILEFLLRSEAANEMFLDYGVHMGPYTQENVDIKQWNSFSCIMRWFFITINSVNMEKFGI